MSDLLSFLVTSLGRLPAQVVVLAVAALPISELRGAIPLGLSIGLSPLEAFLWAVIGNFLPVVPVLLLLEATTGWLMRYRPSRRLLTWVFGRTRRRSSAVQRYGLVGLVLLVAIPLPTTGAWTGCIAAYLLGIEYGRAIPAIFTGTLIAGVVVVILSVGMSVLV